MNKYAAIFFGFIAIIIIAYFVTRTTVNSDAKGQDLTLDGKQEVVVKKYSTADKKKFLKETGNDYYMGKDLAPVVIIEYASLSCPHCAVFHENVVEPLIPTYIETGKVKYVFRDYPLNKPALDAAKIAHCSGKDRYFGFLKVLFQSQEMWVLASDKELPKIAAIGGIAGDAYKTCLENKEIEEKILKVQKDGGEILEIKSTPTIFINGQQYKGKHRFQDVADVIDKQLKGE